MADKKYPTLTLVMAMDENNCAPAGGAMGLNSSLVQSYIANKLHGLILLDDASFIDKTKHPFRNREYAVLNNKSPDSGWVMPLLRNSIVPYYEFGNDDPLCLEPIGNALKYYNDRYDNITILGGPITWRNALSMGKPDMRLRVEDRPPLVDRVVYFRFPAGFLKDAQPFGFMDKIGKAHFEHHASFKALLNESAKSYTHGRIPFETDMPADKILICRKHQESIQTVDEVFSDCFLKEGSLPFPWLEIKFLHRKSDHR